MWIWSRCVCFDRPISKHYFPWPLKESDTFWAWQVSRRNFPPFSNSRVSVSLQMTMLDVHALCFALIQEQLYRFRTSHCPRMLPTTSASSSWTSSPRSWLASRNTPGGRSWPALSWPRTATWWRASTSSPSPPAPSASTASTCLWTGTPWTVIN